MIEFDRELEDETGDANLLHFDCDDVTWKFSHSR